MEVILKNADAFANWHLAFEFLKRSRANYLVANGEPHITPREDLVPQIVLRGTSAGGRYVSVPQDMPEDLVLALCTALASHRNQTDHPWLGSIRSTNFINFLNEFAVLLAGKFVLSDVAQAITDKTHALFEADATTIMMPNEDGDYKFTYVTTEDPELVKRLTNLTVPKGKGVYGWVAENRRSLLIDDKNRALFNDPDIDARAHFTTRDMLATPIVNAAGDLLGVLEILNKRQGHFKRTDLRLIQLIAAIISVFIDKARLFEERLQFAKVEKELEIALTLQRSIMPSLPSRIGPFHLDGESHQVRRVGGDFWDVLELNDQEALLILGDVSGHGLPASLLMSSVRTASRALLPQLGSPEALIEPLNGLIHKEFGYKGHYATLLFCHLDLVTHQVRYLRAGHEYPVLQNLDGHFSMKKRGGLPMGLFPFRKTDHWYTLDFTKGQALYLYTDGVIDGLDVDEDEEIRLEHLLEQYPELGAKIDHGAFLETLKLKAGWREQDDTTILRLTL